MLFSEQLNAQQPDWLDYKTRENNYPSAIYFSGFMSGYLDKEKDVESAKNSIIQQARVQLSENIRISIESEIVNRMTNINSVSQEEFEKVSRSYSSLNLSGLKTDFYIDSRKREVLAFAWIKKSQVINHYSNLITAYVQQARDLAEQCADLVDKDQARSLKIVFTSQKVFREIEEAQTILLMCGVDDPEVLQKTNVIELKREITENEAILNDVRSQSVGELSAYIAAALKIQVGNINGPLYLSNITYRNSEMGSEFSERFSVLLIKDLTSEGFEVGSVSDRAQPGYLLSGHYWEHDGNELQVLMTLSQDDAESKLVIGAAEARIATEVLLNSRLEYKPSNYFEAIKKAKMFSQNEIVNGGARLEIWTNKGEDGLIFREGEKVRLFIRLNQTGYVRLINHWADGTQVLLVDNYFIDYRKVNRIIQLPLEWEVACPCGAEFIQANAQSIAFVPLETETEEGFQFITHKADQFIVKNRSSRLETLHAGGFSVEERIVLATLE